MKNIFKVLFSQRPCKMDDLSCRISLAADRNQTVANKVQELISDMLPDHHPYQNQGLAQNRPRLSP